MTPTQHRSTGLTSLPTELVLRVTDFIEPPSQVSLACASRYLASCCHRLFSRRRAAHEKYGVSSDLDPSTVPHLLRSALGFADPIDAWSVRSFELWGTRDSWNDWRPFNLRAGVPYTVQDGEPLRWSFLREETEAMVDVFKEEMTEEEQKSARDELHEGKDGFLKAVLLTLLPRLVDVKIVSGASDESLSWLANTIQWGKRRATWPPGFASIRDLAVGVSSGTWKDETRESLSAYTLVSVLQLPQLRSLHYSGLAVDEDEYDDDYESDGVEPVTRHSTTHALIDVCLEPDSLPLERLVLDDVAYLTHEFRDALLEAPLALEAFSLRGNSDEGVSSRLEDTDSFATTLAKSQAASLRRFMLYNVRNLNGYRSAAYYPDELKPCVDLRQICVVASDVELCAMSNKCDVPGPKELFDTLAESFPDSLEALVLAGDELGAYVKCHGFYTEAMDGAVAKVLGEESCLPALKAVFLEQIETREEPERERIFFQETMRAGAEKGVDVYTRTSRRDKVHEIEFLAPLGKYDLLTGPYGRKGKEGLALDLRTGEWGPAGCKACGKCDDCLKVYVPELWDTIRPDTAE